ncbi:MAG: isoprenyl transferase [bacterium]
MGKKDLLIDELKTIGQLDAKRMPRHIAIIMDGNGRWAKQQGLPRIMGHQEGRNSVKEIVRVCGELGIKILTLYAFSTENWKRPRYEVQGLMRLLSSTLKQETDDLLKNNVRLTVIGRISALPQGVQKILAQSIARTAGNTGLMLNLALNYGSRQEIVDAVNKIISNGITSVDEQKFSSFLYTARLPDPDLYIRTSGEMRMSNFLLWQSAYSEMYFTPVFWPAFRKKHLIQAIYEYQQRERRFGGRN